MELVFIKGTGKFDRLDVIGPHGRVETIDCPKQGIIPHDMVHYAVERTLNRRGFIRRISEGERAAFQMSQDSETDSVERLVEVFQGDGWSGGTSAPHDVIEMYRVTCAAKACTMLQIEAGDVEAVRATIAELTAQWAKVAPGEALRLVV